MSLYAIGDLHLSLGTDKPMDVFGGEWQDYVQKIRIGFEGIAHDDTVVLCGDLSWATSLQEADKDFRFLSELPGRKILLKGNHDYWWSTMAKMRKYFLQSGFNGFEILHNNCVKYGSVALCGTRGWFFEEEFEEGHDEKVYKRELLRLKASLEAGRNSGAERIFTFLHYPPLYQDYECEDIIRLMSEYGSDTCCFGHLHGHSHRRAVTGMIDGIDYKLVSADYVRFEPVRLLP